MKHIGFLCVVYITVFTNGCNRVEEQKNIEPVIQVKKEKEILAKDKSNKKDEKHNPSRRTVDDKILYEKLSKININDTPDPELPSEIQDRLDGITEQMLLIQKEIDGIEEDCQNFENRIDLGKGTGSENCKRKVSLNNEMQELQSEYSALISPYIDWRPAVPDKRSRDNSTSKE